MFWKKEQSAPADEKQKLINQILQELDKQKKSNFDNLRFLLYMQSFMCLAALFFTFYRLSRNQIESEEFSVYSRMLSFLVAIWVPSPIQQMLEKWGKN